MGDPMKFESFVREYGTPKPDTAADLARLRLDHSAGLRELSTEVGAGVFGGGFISLMSVREAVDSLGGWERWLPAGARLFGCSAFGVLMTTTTGEDVWIVDTQYGQVVESDDTIEDFIGVLATPDCRETVLREPLFKLWNEVVGGLPPTSVLSPTPALPMGGRWSVDTLNIVTLAVYLSFTAQLFGPEGGTPVEVHRRGK